MWLRRLVSASIRSGWIALIPVLALVVASKVANVGASTPRLLMAFGAPFAVALVAQLRHRPTRYDAARQVDRQLHLQERLTTALELHTAAVGPSPLVRAQLEDTVERIRTVDPSEAVPMRMPTRHAVALVALLGLSGLLAVAPPVKRSAPASDALVQKSIAQEAKRLDQLAKEVAPLRPDGQLTREQAAAVAALQALQQANQQQPGMTREDALAKLSDAEAQLRLQQSGTAADTQQALEKAASVLATDQSTRDLARSMTGGKPADTASTLQQLAQSASGMSQDQRDRLAATLRAAGAQAAKTDPSVGQALQRAGDAAASTDAAQRSQAFDQASAAIQQAQLATASQAEVQRALSQMQASQQAISQAGQQGPSLGSEDQSAQQDQQGQQGQSGAQAQAGQGADAPTGVAQSQGASADSQSAAAGQSGAQGQASAQGQGQGEGNQSTQGNGQGQAGGQGHGAGQPGPSGGQGERVYDPKSVPTHQVQVNGQQSATGRQQIEQGTGPQDPTGSQALVPYSQLYQQYKQQASDTLDSSYIPLNMKDLVRDYFTSLAPSK